MQLDLSLYQPWLDYTLFENQAGVFDVLEDYGYPEPQSGRDYLRTVDNFIREYGDEAIEILKTTHPDYDMFMRMKSNYRTQKPTVKKAPQQSQQQSQQLQTNTPTAQNITQDDKDFIKKVITISLAFIGVVQILKILNNRAN